MTDSRVSLIVSNYNYGGYLETCIESALAQTFPHTEIIVVDDGSTDSSRAILEKYKDRVTLVLKDHAGESAARNAGFLRSTGAIVAFLDSDDFLRPDTVARVIAEWKPAFAKLQFPMRIVDRSGADTGLLMPRCRLDEGRVGHLLLSTGRYITAPGSGNFYARWLLDRIMPVPTDEWPQSVDSYCAAFAGFYGEIGAIHDPLAFYRVHDANVSGSVAAGAIDLSQIARLMGRAERLRSLIQTIARDLRLQPHPGIVTRHWLYLKLQLTRLRLEGDCSTRTLFEKAWRMILSALTASELSPIRRAELIAWTLSTIVLPRRAALPIIKFALQPAPSGSLPRALRRL